MRCPLRVMSRKLQRLKVFLRRQAVSDTLTSSLRGSGSCLAGWAGEMELLFSLSFQWDVAELQLNLTGDRGAPREVCEPAGAGWHGRGDRARETGRERRKGSQDGGERDKGREQ